MRYAMIFVYLSVLLFSFSVIGSAGDPTREELLAESIRLSQIFRAASEQIGEGNREAQQAFQARFQDEATGIAEPIARLSPTDFNFVVAGLLEAYARAPRVEGASRTGLSAIILSIAVSSQARRMERRDRSLPVDALDGALMGAGGLMLVRIGARLSRVGIFRQGGEIAARLTARVTSRFSSRAGSRSLSTGREARPNSLIERLDAVRPRTQLGVAVLGGGTLGAIDYGAIRLSTDFVDPASVMLEVQTQLALVELAIPACAISLEARSLTERLAEERGNEPSPELAQAVQRFRERATGILRGVAEATRLAPQLTEPRAVEAPEVLPDAAQAVLGNVAGASAHCSLRSGAVALSSVALDLAPAQRFVLEWTRRFPPPAPAAGAASDPVAPAAQ